MSRSSFLTTYDLARLDNACKAIHAAWPYCTYLVGSAGESGEYRDVDVRTILSDEEFDRTFGPLRVDADETDGEEVWQIVCMGITAYLRDATGLPIDYQIQRLTEANAYHKGSRNPLGLGDGNRFAGGGDATRFEETAP